MQVNFIKNLTIIVLLTILLLFQKNAVAKTYTEITKEILSATDTYYITTDSQIKEDIELGTEVRIAANDIELKIGNDDMTAGNYYSTMMGSPSFFLIGTNNWLITVATAPNKGIYAQDTVLDVNASFGKVDLISGKIWHEDTSDNSTISLSESNVSISLAEGTAIYNNRISDIPVNYVAALEARNSGITIDNSGEIYGIKAFYLKSNSYLNLTNNLSGNVYSLSRNTIDLSDSSSATIVNYGTISSYNSLSDNVVINIDSGKLDLTNNAGVINGKILLGSNANSSITLNGGVINGDISVGNNSQKINLNGGSLIGSIDGSSTRAGIVDIGGNFTLSSSSKLGSVNGIETINVKSGAKLTSNGYANVAAINILSQASMSLESDNISATDVNVSGNLDFGNSNRTLNSNLTILENGIIDINSSSHNISESLSLNSGSVINTRFSTSGILGKITSTKVANVNSNVKININVDEIYDTITNGSSYSLVSGSSGSSINKVTNNNIRINGVNSNSVNNLKTTLTFSSEASDNELLLKVNRIDTDANIISTTSANAASIYKNIVGLSAMSGSLLSFYEQNSSEDIIKRLKSISPQSDDGIRQTSVNILNNSIKSIEGRLDTKRNLTFKKKGKTYRLNKDGEIWGQFFASNANQNNLSENDGDGYKSNSSGIIFGMEEKISKNTIIGAAFNYSNSDIKSSDNSKKTYLKSYQANIYSDHMFGNFFIDNILSFTFNKYESSRAINSLSLTANSNYNGVSYAGRIRGGFVNKISDNLSLIPESSLTFSNNSVDNYTEKNADTLNLHVKQDSTKFLEGRVGLNLNYQVETKAKSLLNYQIKSSFGYDFLGKENNLNTNFVGQSLSFVVKTSKYDPKSLRVGASVSLLKSNSVELSAEYVLELKSNYKSNLGLLRSAYRF